MYDNIISCIKKCLPSNIDRYAVHEPSFSEHINKEVNKCIKSTYVSSSGSHIEKFTEYLKKLTGSKYIVLTTSGTSALFCALNEVNVENHEVIVPSMTFIATANSVIYAGGSPVFIDSLDSSLNIDEQLLDDYLNENYKAANGKCINKKNKKY